MIVVALGATMLLIREQTTPPTVEEYQNFLETPSEKITFNAFKKQFGDPTYQKTVGGGEFTYFNFNPNDYKYPHQFWQDSSGKMIVARVYLPEQLREDEKVIPQKYTSDSHKYTQYNEKYGQTTIIAFPTEGKSFVIDDTTHHVLEWMFYPPISKEEYLDLFVQREEGDQDAP
jgi:hypothetical protein